MAHQLSNLQTPSVVEATQPCIEPAQLIHPLIDHLFPDPRQPRRVLPDDLQQRLHARQVTPEQAIREYVDRTRSIARQSGYPFKGLAELLPDDIEASGAEARPAEKGSAPPHDYPPQLQTLRGLVVLAATIRSGLIYPLSVVQSAPTSYRIVHGERRFWAIWLLILKLLPSNADLRTIRCEVVTEADALFLRMASENSARADLNAIAKARMVALLLLEAKGAASSQTVVGLDFYRRALDLRLPKGQAQAAYSAANMSMEQFSRYKGLLALSEEASILADEHNVEEGHLRHVLKVPKADQAEMVRQIITERLTDQQVARRVDECDDHSLLPSPQARRLVWILEQLPDVREVGDLVARRMDSQTAVARIDDLQQTLAELRQQLLTLRKMP